MSTSSLTAYAAWLAKHESKAARKRRTNSLDSASSSVAEEEKNEENADPYLQWLHRKESKLPLVKVVAASPQAARKISSADTMTTSLDLTNMTSERLLKESTRPRRSEAVDVPHKDHTSRPTKGTKRRAASESPCNSRARIQKKMKVGGGKSYETSTATSAPLTPTKSTAASHSLSRGSRQPSALNTKLPMLDEVKYWRDVDRFSFLA